MNPHHLFIYGDWNECKWCYLVPKISDTGISSVTFEIIKLDKTNNYAFIRISGEEYSKSINEYLGHSPLDWILKADGSKNHYCIKTDEPGDEYGKQWVKYDLIKVEVNRDNGTLKYY